MRAELKTVLDITGGLRRRYLAALAALSLGAVFSYLAPLVAAGVIDELVARTGEAAQAGGGALASWPGVRALLAENLWLAAAVSVLLTSLAGGFIYLRGRWSATAAETAVSRLRDRLYDHLQHLPCRFHDGADTGDLVQRCSSDVETLRNFLAEQVVEVGRALLMVAIALPVMFWMDARMAAVSVVLFPPIVAFSLWFFGRVQTVFKAADEAEGEMTTVLQENLTGIRVVRAFARQDYEREKFARRNRDYRDKNYRMIRLLAIYWPASDILCMGQVGLVLIVGAWRIQEGSLTVGALFAFLTWIGLLIWPVRQLGRVLTEAGKSVVAIRRLHDILHEPTEPAVEYPAAAPMEPLRGAIEFRNVSFAHAQGQPVLHDISLSVQPGETVALLGPPGSGKSTLMHLLLRLYDYEQGAIRLDGIELRALPRKEVRAAISSVLQEPFLYSKTLRDNLRLGRGDAPDEELVAVADTACIHETIVGFAHGYDTLVGERGVTLSGGQRQRVALARALLRETPVLVLDDALSAVDTGTENRIREALTARRGRHTTFVIAHRLSTVAAADRIVVLDEGRIVQTGPHSELAERDGPYRRLWRLQTALEEDMEGQLRAS